MMNNVISLCSSKTGDLPQRKTHDTKDWQKTSSNVCSSWWRHIFRLSLSLSSTTSSLHSHGTVAFKIPAPCGRCVPTTNQDITESLRRPHFPIRLCPLTTARGIYWKEVKYAKIVWMYRREHFRIRPWQRPSHIVIPPWKNGCANLIITLFQLIKCMIIPWREIRGFENNGLTKLLALIGQPSVLLSYALWKTFSAWHIRK